MTSYGTEVLAAEECLRLLASRRVGRVAVSTGERPAILPVVYALLDGDVVFRTAPGEKLIAAVLHCTVAFEADDFDEAEGAGWSVNVVGPAEEITHPDERARAEALGLDPWAGGDVRDRFVRIRSEHGSGRRVRRSG